MLLRTVVVLLMVLLILVIIYFVTNWMLGRIRNGKKNMECRILWKSEFGEFNPSICQTPNNGIWITCRRSNMTGRALYDHLRDYMYTKFVPSFRQEAILIHRELPAVQSLRSTHKSDESGVDGYNDNHRAVDPESPLTAWGDLHVQVPPYVWKGTIKYPIFEDARLFYSEIRKEYWFTATGYDLRGRIQPVLLHLDTSTNSIIRVILLITGDNKIHKNWTLFEDQERRELCLLTDIAPDFCIRSVSLDSGVVTPIVKQESASFLPYDDIRCTSPPVSWDNSHLICAAHVVRWPSVLGGIIKNKLFQTVFIVFERRFPYRIRAYSDPVHFFDFSQVEFASGLLRYDDQTFYATLGKDNEHGYLIELQRDQIENRLLYIDD